MAPIRAQPSRSQFALFRRIVLELLIVAAMDSEAPLEKRASELGGLMVRRITKMMKPAKSNYGPESKMGIAHEMAERGSKS
jgi:hypothetical protein